MQEWVVDTTDGEIRCRYLVAAPGALSEPGLPTVPGADEFTGTMFHSADWDHSHDLHGRRVAVVGTGADVAAARDKLLSLGVLVTAADTWRAPLATEHPVLRISPHLDVRRSELDRVADTLRTMGY